MTATGGHREHGRRHHLGRRAARPIQIDASRPTANTSDPLDNAVLTGTSKTISGTASDGIGLGRLAPSRSRSPAPTASTGPARAGAGTEHVERRDRHHELDLRLVARRRAEQRALHLHDHRASDRRRRASPAPTRRRSPASRSTTSPRRSSRPPPSTRRRVDVVFSEALQSGSISASDFTIAGLTVSDAVLQADNVTVRLTTSAQTPARATRSQCAAGNVLDVAGNGNTLDERELHGLRAAGHAHGRSRRRRRPTEREGLRSARREPGRRRAGAHRIGRRDHGRARSSCAVSTRPARSRPTSPA